MNSVQKLVNVNSKDIREIQTEEIEFTVKYLTDNEVGGEGRSDMKCQRKEPNTWQKRGSILN